jgi:signal transduction histidine kinase
MKIGFIRGAILFGVFVVIAVAVPGGFTVASFSAYRQASQSIARTEQLRGEIRRLDEVLTMSARMAATTGEERWIDRYNANVDPLDHAIKEMIALSGSPHIEAMVRATDQANLALVGMETRSFELVHHHRRRAAYRLLMSPEYQLQKAIYADGMTRAMAAVHAAFSQETDRSWRALLLASIFSVLGVAACCATWVLLMRRSFREHERLHHLAEAERDAAKAANAAKSMFLASMSHELRTPLNAVIGYSEMLREGAEEDARKSDIADHDRVISAARRLLTLIDDLLDLSKAEAGKIVLRPKSFGVRALVESTIATIAPAAAARGNKTGYVIASDVGEAFTDEFRLGQCLLNLLSNAAKFTNQGDISVVVRREQATGEDWLVFQVADTGVGMTEAQLNELFQPFAQADAAVAHAHGGTGLGLAITRQLARLLGGDVTVASAPGRGSVFTLRIPADFPSPHTAETQATLLAA